MYERSIPPFVRGSSAGGAAPVQSPAVAASVVSGGLVPPGDRAAQSLTSTLEATFQRLEEVIDQETAALRAGGQIDLKSFNDRKSQVLLELSRLLKHVKALPQNPELEKRIGGLQSKIAINQAVLKIHLEAVREISATLSNAIREADSDGTYTPAIYGAYRRQ